MVGDADAQLVVNSETRPAPRIIEKGNLDRRMVAGFQQQISSMNRTDFSDYTANGYGVLIDPDGLVPESIVLDIQYQGGDRERLRLPVRQK